MKLKNKLKERLLDIPIKSRAYREKNKLADDLDEDVNNIEFYLNELCSLGIMTEEKQYICNNCGDTTILTNDDLSNLLEDGYFMCDNCCEPINPLTDVTGFIYYDIDDVSALEEW